MEYGVRGDIVVLIFGGSICNISPLQNLRVDSSIVPPGIGANTDVIGIQSD